MLKMGREGSFLGVEGAVLPDMESWRVLWSGLHRVGNNEGE